jgi:hypothetical protein
MGFLLIERSGDSPDRMADLAEIARTATHDYAEGDAIVETLHSVAEAYRIDAIVGVDALCINSTRYCLGRQSYAVGENCDNLRRLWPVLSTNAKAVIIRDIKEELARPGGGGAEMDRKSWRSLLQSLENKSLAT